MKKKGIVSLACALFSFFPFGGQASTPEESSNAITFIHLDAENLAEQGIKEAYDGEVLPHLRAYVENPIDIEEIVDADSPEYSVVTRDQRYCIYNGQINEYDSWGYATYALFDIVNRQLASSDYRFYAFYGSNDLSGAFMTEKEHQDYVGKLAKKTDIPYFPSLKAPWFGQPHD